MNEREMAAQLAHPHGERATEVGENLVASNQMMIQGAVDALALTSSDQVLEIGMAAGRHVDEQLRSAGQARPGLARPGHARPGRIHFTGLDISVEMMQEARRINASRVADSQAAYTLGSSEHLPCPISSLPKYYRSTHCISSIRSPVRVRSRIAIRRTVNVGLRSLRFYAVALRYGGYSTYEGANISYNHVGDTRWVNISLSYLLGGKLKRGKKQELEEEKSVR